MVTRWAKDDHALLQPTTPCWITMASFTMNLFRRKVATKELQLCGLPTTANKHIRVPTRA